MKLRDQEPTCATVACHHVLAGELATLVLVEADGTLQIVCDADHADDAAAIVPLAQVLAQHPELGNLDLRPGMGWDRSGSGKWRRVAADGPELGTEPG